MATLLENKFRDAKNVLHTLSNYVSSAERGMIVDLPSIQTDVQELVSDLTRISQGLIINALGSSSRVLPASSTFAQRTSPTLQSGVVTNPLTSQVISPFTSLGNVRPNELQKRKAEALLTELHQSLDYLTRLERRNAANRSFLEKKKEILGENFSSANAWHPTQGETDLEEKERKTLEYLSRRFAHMEEESHEVLSALKRQGRQLAESHSKFGSVIEAIGWGDSAIGHIVRRNNVDALIVYVGVFFLLFVMWKIWVYRKA